MAQHDNLNRIRKFFEKLAFAGLKPAVSGTPAAKKRQTRLWAPVDRLLSGGAQSDPLYLSRRTFAQRLRIWVVIGLPAALVITGLGMVMMGLVTTAPPPPPKEMTPAQVAAKLLPDLNKAITLPADNTLEVADVHIEHSGSAKVVGTVRNTTSTAVPGADISFDLTNVQGSRMGAVSTHVDHVPAHGSVTFEIPIEQEKAAFAIVREVRRL